VFRGGEDECPFFALTFKLSEALLGAGAAVAAEARKVQQDLKTLLAERNVLPRVLADTDAGIQALGGKAATTV